MRNLLVLFAALAACSSQPAAPEGTAGAPAGEHTEPAEAVAVVDAEGWAHYGAPFAQTDVLPASNLLGDPTVFVGKTIRVEGRVADVCQKAGCWMIIADGDKTMRIRMKDHAFSVDKAGAGATASIEGLVVEVPLDPDTVKHYAEESVNKDVMPENTAVGKVYEIEATGVAFKRG